MRIVTPAEIEPNNLISSNAVNEYPDWAPGSYDTGERVAFETSVWESLENGVSDQPGSPGAPWLRLGYTNEWRMFRDGRDSRTTGVDSIEVVFSVQEPVTTIGLLGLLGSEATVRVVDSLDGVVYERLLPLVDIGVQDWWEFFFLPYEVRDSVVFDSIPPYPGSSIELSVAGSDVSIGRVVAGVDREMGATLTGTSVSFIDYSVKERDSFGNLTLLPRRTIRLVDFDVMVESDRTESVVQAVERLSTVPALYIGSDRYGATSVFGVYRSFTSNIMGDGMSFYTLQVEGF